MNKHLTDDLIEDLNSFAYIIDEVADRRDLTLNLTDGDIFREAADEIDILFQMAQELYVALMGVTYVQNHGATSMVLDRAIHAMDFYDDYNLNRTYFEQGSDQ